MNHIEAMKKGALAMCNEVTNLIEKQFENAGTEQAKEFAEALKSSKATEMMESAMKDIKNFNNTKF